MDDVDFSVIALWFCEIERSVMISAAELETICQVADTFLTVCRVYNGFHPSRFRVVTMNSACGSW
jgi:hypothetical protein